MKKIKILTIILAIVLITMVSFFGVYTQVQNRMENQIKQYSYAMDIEGTRSVRLALNDETNTIIKDAQGNEVEDTEELTDEQIQEKGYTKEEIPVNSEEVKKVENYKKSKEIIEKRLKLQGLDNYIIKLEENTGDIIVEIKENAQTDSIISNINTVGKFEVIDSETKEVLMNNNDLKEVKVMYGVDGTSGTTIYLNMEFDKEGTKKLKEITSTYKTIEETEENENAEETENENIEETNTTNSTNATNETSTETTEEVEELKDGTEKEKQVTIKIDDSEFTTTSFKKPVENGILQFSMGSSSTDLDSVNETAGRATRIATILNCEAMPVRYEIEENQYIYSDITNEQLQMAEYIALGVIALALIVLIIRYKLLGILGAVSYVGFTSLLMLIVRYTNIVLSIEGFIGIVAILILNYILVNKLLKQDNQNEIYKDFFIKTLPIIILSIVFCFIVWEPISNFGMVMFWGFFLIAIYNMIITNSLVKIKAGKEK